MNTTRAARALAIASAAAAATAIAMLTPAPANADKPTRVFATQTGPNLIEGMCDFPVDQVATLIGHITYSADGSTEFYHVTETDTFSANGHTLASIPYTFSLHATLDEAGNYEHIYATGQAVVVPISQGVTFRAAGRLDFIHYDNAFAWVPESGTSKNLDAFCAALAP